LLVNNPADVASNHRAELRSASFTRPSTQSGVAIEVTLFFFPLFNVTVRETVFSTTTLLIGCQLEVPGRSSTLPVVPAMMVPLLALFQREHVAAIQPRALLQPVLSAIVSKEHAAKFAVIHQADVKRVRFFSSARIALT